MKVGDRVKVVEDNTVYHLFYGKILSTEGSGFMVLLDGKNCPLYFMMSEIAFVPNTEVYLWESPDGCFLAHEGGLDDLPEEAVRVWKRGDELKKEWRD